jgi:hypothetical protein
MYLLPRAVSLVDLDQMRHHLLSFYRMFLLLKQVGERSIP